MRSFLRNEIIHKHNITRKCFRNSPATSPPRPATHPPPSRTHPAAPSTAAPRRTGTSPVAPRSSPSAFPTCSHQSSSLSEAGTAAGPATYSSTRSIPETPACPSPPISAQLCNTRISQSFSRVSSTHLAFCPKCTDK